MALKSISIGLRKRTSSYSTNSQTGKSQRGYWWDLLAALARRSGGLCEAIVNGRRCGARAVDGHHIKPLRLGGTNTLANLIHLCEHHHEQRHVHLAKIGYAQNRAEILAKKKKK